MPDAFRKVQPGERLQIPAVAYNAMIDAAQAEKLRRGDRTHGDLTTGRNADIVRVRNDTETDLPRFSVLALAGPIFLSDDFFDAFFQEVTFRGVVPTAEHDTRFCVLLEPVPVDGIARAYVSGVCIVGLDVLDEADEFADVAAGQTGWLESGTAGAAQVLWREGEDAYGGGFDEGYGYTGLQWAIVRLGVGGSGGSVNRWVEVTGGDITPGATGTVSLPGGGSMEVVNQFEATTIPDGVMVWIHKDGGTWRFGVFECPEGYY